MSEVRLLKLICYIWVIYAPIIVALHYFLGTKNYFTQLASPIPFLIGLMFFFASLKYNFVDSASGKEISRTRSIIMGSIILAICIILAFLMLFYPEKWRDVETSGN